MTATATTEPSYPRVTILYGSQTGNSTLAAEDFAKSIGATAESPMELDDWLQQKPTSSRNDTDIWIIFVSTYGMGGAPLGSQQFRRICDELQEQSTETAFLQGIQYAICGLGNSQFATYMENPRTIDAALARAGATRLLDLNPCDADGKQQDAIRKFHQDLRQVLLRTSNNAAVDLSTVRTRLHEVAQRVVPEWMGKGSGKGKGGGTSIPSTTLLFFVLTLLIVVVAYAMQNM